VGHEREREKNKERERGHTWDTRERERVKERKKERAHAEHEREKEREIEREGTCGTRYGAATHEFVQKSRHLESQTMHTWAASTHFSFLENKKGKKKK